MSIFLVSWLTFVNIIATGTEPEAPSPPQPIPHPVDAIQVDQPERLSHLHQAIEHLRAAGLEEESSRVEEILKNVRAEQKQLLDQKRQELLRLEKEVSELEAQLGEGQIFEIELTVGEINLSKLRQLGVSLDFFETNDGNTDTGILQASAIKENAVLSQTLTTEVFQSILESLKASSVLKVTAQPKLVTTIGRPATFRSGGEFPILVPQKDGQVNVEFRDFGLTFDTVVNTVSDQEIRLDIAHETAERNFDNAVAVNGFQVPGLNVRKVNTEVQMKNGETVVLGGVVEEKNGESKLWFAACSPKRVQPLTAPVE